MSWPCPAGASAIRVSTYGSPTAATSRHRTIGTSRASMNAWRAMPWAARIANQPPGRGASHAKTFRAGPSGAARAATVSSNPVAGKKAPIRVAPKAKIISATCRRIDSLKSGSRTPSRTPAPTSDTAAMAKKRAHTVPATANGIGYAFHGLSMPRTAPTMRAGTNDVQSTAADTM